jgi:glyoxylase-like metal-dependent hydrolase (beta-lactamase superfamily II)
VDNRTEQLADGVWRVEVAAFVNAYVLTGSCEGDPDGLTLVDPGPAGAAPRLVRSVRMLGFDPRAVADVLLTHWHAGTAGGAAAFAASSAAPRVWIGAGDLPVLTSGARPPLELGTSALVRVVQRRLRVPAPVPAARALEDGQALPPAGGVEVVSTPGHTRGHVAFHLAAHAIVLTGDALWTVPAPWPGPGFLAAGRTGQRQTFERLAALHPTLAAPAHGPPLADPAPTLTRLGGS